MELDTQNALLTLEAGLAQLSTLIVSYSFSAIGAVILLIVGYMIAGFAERSIFAGLKRIRGFDLTLCHFFSKIARYAILVLVVVMVLGQFGVQTASIIAAIGAIGLAVGLALQGTLQNIAAGIMLLVLRPFRLGEYVEIGGVSGTIEEIGLFATSLRTVDGVYILAPNSTLWNQPVFNYTRNGVRRNDITIGIGYNDDIAAAQKILLDLAVADGRVKKEPEPTAFVAALADSAVSVTLRYWTSASDFLTAKFDLTRQAKEAFDTNGISIPFPQQEVIYREMPTSMLTNQRSASAKN
jgi:small conductance mechanosensitive channel